jgi:hypothetical protein
MIRRKSADFGIPLITDVHLARRFIEAMSKKGIAELQIKSWQEYAPAQPNAPRPAAKRDDELRPAA